MRGNRGVAVGLVAALSSILVAAGCDSGDSSGAAAADELEEHGGEYCPGPLPLAPKATYGFGTEEPATEEPELKAPEIAWVCRYDTTDVSGRGSGGAHLRWDRAGEPVRLTTAQVAALGRIVRSLEPVEPQGCTDDLGPRYLWSYSSGTDLTGIVVDDYGCGDIRLTDDPFTTVAGSSEQDGVVPGVLAGVPALADGRPEALSSSAG